MNSFSIVLKIFITLLIMTISTPAFSSASNTTNLLSLLSFKSLLSDPDQSLASWSNTNLHFCLWRGISCHSSGDVTGLHLYNLHLAGIISPSLSNLTSLTKLDLSTNNFHGSIPQELSRLHNLQLLNLSYNSLSGPIPSNLSSCSSLRSLFLNYNMLEGQIPAELGFLSMLRLLNLGGNRLIGGIPGSLSNISSFTSLLLYENGLAGNIPESFGKLTNFRLFQIRANQISGEIPSSLLNISSIEIFFAGQNLLSGSLPPNMFDTLPNLQMLLLNDNQLIGNLPVSLPNASNLVEIDVKKNGFSGKIPSSLGGLKNLFWMNLGYNFLEANEADDWEFLTSLTNCTKLGTLVLGYNRLRGVFPRSLVNLSSTIDKLSLSFNQISGSIPDAIGNLVNLSGLAFGGNNLSGRIPNTIGRLSRLNYLHLTENNFTGELPSSLGNLTQLGRLELGASGISGTILASIGNCKELEILDLSQNKLSKGIPRELFSIASLLVLNLSSNSLSGKLLGEVDEMQKIYHFDISHNNLLGEIPSTLGKCERLVYLYMQDNFFEGTIPSSLSKLVALQEVDISRNNLSGEIPKFFGMVHFIYLNLSSNDLEGDVPSDGVFKNASAVSLTGNNKLCGGPPQLDLPACFTQTLRRSKKKLPLKIILPCFCIALCLVLISFAILKLRLRKNARNRNLVTDPTNVEWMKISYGDLLKATNGFSSSNLMGVGSFGSVYKGILDSDESIVAIKVLNLQQHGAIKSFLTECEVLRNIRHRNLVKIFSTCSSINFNGDDFKALILEFMPNGSLDKWLHPKVSMHSNPRTLSLRQRFNIAFDVASALDYLHHHGHKPIVHCDLKPSNVLLDGDMIAHLSDFGLSRFLTSDRCPNSSIGIKGSIGYIAPEYGTGNPVSTQGDVFSYGVLLLEMFTGKRPTDEMYTDAVGPKLFVEMALPERVFEVADPHLFWQRDEQEARNCFVINDQDRLEAQKCLFSVFRIGLSCLELNPGDRLDMKAVLKEMVAIRESIIWHKIESQSTVEI